MPASPFVVRNRTFASVLALSVFLFALHFFRLVDFHELNAIDLRFQWRGEQKAHPDIVLIEIDDGSLTAIGQWPWPRNIHAALLDLISRYKPKSIFFDVLFTDAGPEPKDDDIFAFAVKKAGNVYLPFYYSTEKPFRASFPIPRVRQAAKGTGYVNTGPDADGHFRRILLSIPTPQGVFYHASAAPFPEQRKNVPVDSKNYFQINYPGSIRSFKRVSFREVISSAGTAQEKNMRALFENRVVMIGHTATGSTDLKPTPFSTSEPGIAIQASAVHTLLTGRYLRIVPAAADLLILIFLSLFVAWTTQKTSPVRGLLLASGTQVTYGLINFILFLTAGWIFLLFVPMAAIALSYALTLFFKFIEIRLQGELLERELSTAARIQGTFLSQNRPEIPGLDAGFQCKFAKQVGGDFYDWQEFVEDGGRRLSICIGDVSGKGVPAALYMAKALNDFRREAHPDSPPGKVCGIFNNLLAHSGGSGMFLTFFYAIVEPANKTVFFCNAGHEPMMLYRKSMNKTEVLKSVQGPPLGLFEDTPYETDGIAFEPGDAFLLLSDGVKELRNPKGQELGMEKVRELFEAEARASGDADKIIRAIFQAMQAHQRTAAPHDDRTLVCVTFPG